MPKVELNKNDTISIIYKNKKINANKNRYAFSTKYPWNCLGCLKELFVSYNQFGCNAIFCNSCKHMALNPNIVQFQYLRVLKDNQLKLIESFEIPEVVQPTENL